MLTAHHFCLLFCMGSYLRIGSELEMSFINENEQKLITKLKPSRSDIVVLFFICQCLVYFYYTISLI